MALGASSHRVEHWFFMGKGKEFDSDVKDPMERGDFYWPAMPGGDPQDIYCKPEPSEEFMQDWLVRTCELIDKYCPKILWFDWWIQHSACKPWLKKVAAYYYNRAAEWDVGVAINYKHDSFLFGTAVPDVERGQFAEIKHYFWPVSYTHLDVYKRQKDGAVRITAKCGKREEALYLRVRIPEYFKKPTLKVNGKDAPLKLSLIHILVSSGARNSVHCPPEKIC